MNGLAQHSDPLIHFVVRWVFRNGHVWTKSFYTLEEAREWVEICDLQNDPDIKEWSFTEEIL